jgi:hypothetical protein
MLFKTIGITVCVLVILDLGGYHVVTYVAAGSNIMKYLSEQQSNDVVTAPPEDISGYQAQCLENWTKRGVINQEMVDSCISHERDGYSNLLDTLKKYRGYSWMARVLRNRAGLDKARCKER